MKNVIEEHEYEAVIYDLYKKLWKFAYLHRDALGDPYITTALARYGLDNQGSETGKEKEERIGIVTENEILPETFGSICYCM